MRNKGNSSNLSLMRLYVLPYFVPAIRSDRDRIKGKNVGLIVTIMLSNITWTQFFTGTFILAIIYYLYIVVRYYPEKLKDLFGGGKTNQTASSPFIADEELLQPAEEATEDIPDAHSDLDDIEELITKLVSAIEQASTAQLDQTEFTWTLELILKERPALKTSPYRPSINELIVSECSKHGNYALSEKEVDKMWEK